MSAHHFAPRRSSTLSLSYHYRAFLPSKSFDYHERQKRGYFGKYGMVVLELLHKWKKEPGNSLFAASNWCTARNLWTSLVAVRDYLIPLFFRSVFRNGAFMVKSNCSISICLVKYHSHRFFAEVQELKQRHEEPTLFQWWRWTPTVKSGLLLVEISSKVRWMC